MTGVLLPNLGLPSLTVFLASDAKTIGDFGLVYHSLPFLRSESEPIVRHLYQSLPPHRRHNTQWIRLCVMWGYNGLELVVYGAVELGDVVLTFIGEQGLTGLEVYARLVGQTDGVCDCGILATGLH